jgi:bifunctional DNA-binding transcriptional regulator/antitoxin component of YhaV-PrlF toxin-antitoxin module
MSKLSSKHQVTIPVKVLREAGLASGDDVVMRGAGEGRISMSTRSIFCVPCSEHERRS